MDSKAIEKIVEKKKKLQDEEKRIKQKERLKQAKSFEEIGRLAYRADIFKLEKDVLYGAFIEIAERSKNEHTIQSWSKLANEKSKDMNHQQSSLTISFDGIPDHQTKNQLKELNFKWNSFRKEYYGYGKKDELESMFKDISTPCKIEVIN